MTADEIALSGQARQEQNKELAQMIAWIVYNGAALTGVAVNDPRKFPKIEDAFPTLFEKKEQQDWWVMKERMENFEKAKKVRMFRFDNQEAVVK
ncbi:MAG: hypothetical protein LBS36_01465 [Oscillospiraceae bacterium]|jgi:hypothetical protein|nr:hypothetical protein [Oscillospiraceae bacterium]